MARAPSLPPEDQVRILTAKPELTSEEANRYGDMFLEAGKFAQAMMFYERFPDNERLAGVKKEAVRMGDAFLLHAVLKLAPDLVDEEEWRQAGEHALRDGKFLFAQECFTKAGDTDRVEEVRKEWLKSFPEQPLQQPPSESLRGGSDEGEPSDEPPATAPDEPGPA